MKRLRGLPTYVLVSAVLLVLGAAIELLIEQVTSTTTWYARLVIWILFAQTGALVYLSVRAAALARELRSQHRAATYVATIEGFWDTLMVGAEQGGLSAEARSLIYQAGKEQFNFYYREIDRGDRYTLVFNPKTMRFETEPVVDAPEVVLPA